MLLMAQAGWHVAHKLVVPSSITILPLSPKCPELSSVENVCPFLRDNWLSNRVLNTHDAIFDQCCGAWNELSDQPWRMTSIGLRDWMNRV